MNIHRKTRLLLYEYLTDELPLRDRAMVDDHVASCQKCARDLDLMRSTLEMLSRETMAASEFRSGKFWNEFPEAVVRKAGSQESRSRNPFLEAADWVEGLFTLHPGYSYGAMVAAVCLLFALALWTLHPSGVREPSLAEGSSSREILPGSDLTPAERGTPDSLSPERVSQYFRRSKILLVGLSNLRPDQDEGLDFSRERRVSRDLIREARYLRQQPIDPRSRRLINDMESILIELSNIEGERGASSMDIIRSGIHHENLLFKIRMAEAVYSQQASELSPNADGRKEF